MTQKIPLSEAALRLGLDYQQCRRLVLTGRLKGGRDEFGRLYVDGRALTAACAAATAGRTGAKSVGSRRASTRHG